MRRSAVIASLLVATLACAAILGACGDSGSSSGTKTATVPHGRVSGTNFAVKPGYYAGMECADFACTDFISGPGREQALSHCRKGQPVPGKPTAYTVPGRTESFVCFTALSTSAVTNFFFGGTQIAGDLKLRRHFIPLTCAQDWCVSAEWNTSRNVTGKIRDPQGLTVNYKAEQVGDLR